MIYLFDMFIIHTYIRLEKIFLLKIHISLNAFHELDKHKKK